VGNRQQSAGSGSADRNGGLLQCGPAGAARRRTERRRNGQRTEGNRTEGGRLQQ